MTVYRSIGPCIKRLVFFQYPRQRAQPCRKLAALPRLDVQVKRCERDRRSCASTAARDLGGPEARIQSLPVKEEPSLSRRTIQFEKENQNPDG